MQRKRPKSDMLTQPTDLIDIRRFCGYPLTSTEIDVKIAAVPDEAAAVVSTYLTNIRSLEAAIMGASDNLDTDKAAVWTRNRTEVQDRDAMFYAWRLRLCNLIGVIPGNNLGPLTMNGSNAALPSGVAVV